MRTLRHFSFSQLLRLVTRTKNTPSSKFSSPDSIAFRKIGYKIDQKDENNNISFAYTNRNENSQEKIFILDYVLEQTLILF